MSDFFKKNFQPVIPGTARERKYFVVAGVVCALLTALDQWTKIIIERSFYLYQSKVVIPDFFSLVYITNKGAAWGILAGRWYLLLGISAAALFCCVFFFRKITENYPERIFAMALLVSGIVGNSVDRIWRGEVVDFLDFYIRIGEKVWHWPAFNVADIAICCGVGIYVLSNLIRPEKKCSLSDKEK